MSAEFAWNIKPKDAIELQKKLSNRVILEPLKKPIKIIAGVDASIEKFSDQLFVAIVILTYPELELLERAAIKIKTNFPYIPGLLSFREIPGILKCYQKIKNAPDVIIVDGQGIAHPRLFGIASHLGVLLDKPTIGCAKSLLFGKFKIPEKTGNTSHIINAKTNELIGIALKSKDRTLPLVISPGHKITINESVNIIKNCLKGYRLPEPTRLAHKFVNEFRIKTKSTI